MPFGPTHTIIRILARAAVESFYDEITVVDGQTVPEYQPLLTLANHGNMTVDPAVLSGWMPHDRKLHYWAKNSLFKHPWASKILLDAGNIPVDRKNKDNALLYSGTFAAFRSGECVAVFPEGTSVNTPGLLALKDGASWTALKYIKSWKEQGADPSKALYIAIVGMTYMEKTRYRSSIVIQHAPAIDIKPYLEEFLVEPKAAVKKLTATIRSSLLSVTIHAESWDSWFAAKMARELLWPDKSKLAAVDFRDVTQKLIDIFESTEDDDPELRSVQAKLLALKSGLDKSGLSNASLGRRSLPRKLDPTTNIVLPRRMATLGNLLLDSLGSLVQLPFFFVPMLFHLPMYLAAKLIGMVLAGDEVESYAQNKIVFGLLVSAFVYPFLFFFLWLVFLLTPVGAVMSFAFVWLFAVYHNRMVNSNYAAAKKLLATWRILIGVWLPFGSNAGIRPTLKLRQEAALAISQYLVTNGHSAYFAQRGARVGKSPADLFSDYNASSPPTSPLVATNPSWR